MMKQRCIIITSYSDTPIKDCLNFHFDDYIICADGGYALAEAAGITPDLVIGDFDSYEGSISQEINIIRVAAEKDDTDTMLCLKTGIEKGFEEFIICGGIGGRLDHTIANLQCLAYAVDCGKKLWIYSGADTITMIEGSRLQIDHCKELKSMGYRVSLFSYSNECTGVCISGVFYPLNNAILKNNFPLGISNEFLEDQITISNSTGKLMIIMSKEGKNS